MYPSSITSRGGPSRRTAASSVGRFGGQNDARDWFDGAWETLGCEPLRPSGKVLLLDKVLGVADALGYDILSTDAKEAREFAEHLALALERPRITVDLPGLTVGY